MIGSTEDIPESQSVYAKGKKLDAEMILQMLESLMMCLVRSNLKEVCQQLWPDFTKIGHERLVPDQAWQFGLYRTGDAATNEMEIYSPTTQWNELQEICKDHMAADVLAALKDDPVLLLLFVNIFPFRASFSTMRFLHREFDRTVSL
uniref:Uncharacterized protein n=1 Tax=Candidatus Kentrum sp. TUN TaxID=2126343 RepID=A0A450ZVJ7_9GAMM|nr:MAG: hypothetical protein BECKTUN1418F_GA0071002_104810 [Candidatus Kentron sp. TUN]VFK57805.1 MAG: hypothetical protein BECKTUN1418E_GA0071001_104710 [Candidatus Kentron sp. TUN]VFK62309.1 MAG: hypothetical protein BECKTUN1418D_GA0071000_11726 [Candidatus Kentron sp. TUN]